jgi:hypothetical protein
MAKAAKGAESRQPIRVPGSLKNTKVADARAIKRSATLHAVTD